MKAAVKIVKSLHVDVATLNALFFGYFLLLAVSATIIFGSNEPSQTAVASKQINTGQTSLN